MSYKSAGVSVVLQAMRSYKESSEFVHSKKYFASHWKVSYKVLENAYEPS
jgi:hypothetical protein